jgi:hypothetical protein
VVLTPGVSTRRRHWWLLEFVGNLDSVQHKVADFWFIGMITRHYTKSGQGKSKRMREVVGSPSLSGPVA